MTVFTGKSVYDAAVCGLICILRKPKLSAERMHVDDISTELKRVEAARIVAAEQLQQLYELFLDKIGESNAQIFNIHMMMLEDEDYNGSIEGMNRSEQVNAEYAVARTSDVFAQMLEAMDNEYMRARSADVRDVSNRLLSILTDTPMDFPWVPENSVVCADDLTPSETAALERRNIAALVTAHGSAISHTAILAHSMNIPTVIGIGDEFLANIRPGEQALVDGFSGEVILEPDAGILSKLTAPQEKSTDTSEGTHTADGTHVSIYSVDDPCAPLPEYADGIAVFGCPLLSDETKQYEYYRAIAERTPDCRAIIRMPVISPKDPDRQIKYDQQIRAVFRAASHGEPGILFPMITSVPEARKILAACDDAKMELRAEGVKCSENVKIGFMAYHEVGHALVTALSKNAEPVQKITIIPRTSGALGYTMQVEQADKYLMTKEEIENKIATLTGGRAAEEVACGEITTGASNDIEQATKLARAMITRYGMSEEFDMVAMETVENQYLGGDTSLCCSADTQKEIDHKVVELVRAQHEKAKKLLVDNKRLLDILAMHLYEKETITGDEFMEILNKEGGAAL